MEAHTLQLLVGAPLYTGRLLPSFPARVMFWQPSMCMLLAGAVALPNHCARTAGSIADEWV